MDSPPPPARRKKAVIVAMALLGASLPAMVLLTTAPSPASAPPPPMPGPTTLQALCQDRDAVTKQDCYLGALRPLLRSNGIRPTFELLENLTAIDAYVRAQEHPLAHALGRDAYTAYPDAPRAFAECPYTMASGCPHGVLEEYLSSQAAVSDQQVRPLCQVVAATQGTFGLFQCLHGLGHGLTMFLMHDLFAALSYCDWLATTWERESCYGGAFMENIVSYQASIASGGGQGASSHEGHSMGTHAGILKPGDPQYPCNAVADTYKRACYTLQSTAFLTLNGYDVRAAFETCMTVEAAYVPTCFVSMGRDISSIAQREPNRTAQLCYEGNDAYEAWCVAGAAKDFVNTAARAGPGLELCAIVIAAHERVCYAAVGEILLTLRPDAAARTGECQGAEPGFVELCTGSERA